MTAYRFSQLTSFIITNITRRRTNQTGHGVFFHIFAHIDTHHIAFIVKEYFRQSFCQLSFTYTGGAKEDETTNRTIGVFNASAGTDNCFTYSLNSFVLPNYTLVQDFFQVYQFFTFATAKTGNGDTCPSADNFGNVFFINFFFQENVVITLFVFHGKVCQFFLQRRQATVFQFSQLVQIVIAFSLLHFLFNGVNFFFHFTHTGDGSLLSVPTCYQFVISLTQFRKLFFNFRKASFRLFVFFLAQSLGFNLQLQNATFAFVKFRRQTVNFSTQSCGSFVNKVDGFVRQEAVIDVPVGKHCRRNKSRIFNAHAVMHFVTFTQATQNGNGVFYAWLFYQNGLEATLQGAVLFNVLTIFVQGSCANATQFATCKHRLQNIACVHATFCSACTNDGVKFVNEHNDLTSAVSNCFENFFQAFFKFATELSTCYEGSQIQSIQGFILQVFRHVTSYNASCQTFCDSSLANAGFTDEYGVILFTTAQNFDNTTNFFVTADNRVQLAFTSLRS